jgi:3-dehydroquinate dehydratase
LSYAYVALKDPQLILRPTIELQVGNTFRREKCRQNLFVLHAADAILEDSARLAYEIDDIGKEQGSKVLKAV